MRVLYVRSTLEQPELLLAALQDVRYRVDSVGDAVSAWDALVRHQHALVILDARHSSDADRMDKDCQRLCERLKGHTPSPYVLALLDATSEPLEGLLHAGVDDFLASDASAHVLAARLHLATSRCKSQARPDDLPAPQKDEPKPSAAPPAPGEERFRRLVAMSPDMVALHADGQWLFVNRAAMTLLAADTEGQLVGQPVADVVLDAQGLMQDRSCPEDWPRGDGTAPVEEGRLQRFDGTTVDVEYVSLPSSFKGQPATQVMVRDMTPRKQAEAALRRSEKRYRELFEGVPVGVFRLSPGGELRNFNRALVDLLGYPDRVQLMGLSFASLFEADDEQERWRKLMQQDYRLDNFEARLSRYDGSVIWVRTTTQAIRDTNGQLLGYEGTAEDVTDRKTVEERLIHDALHDALTQLPNRVLFMDRLALSLQQRDRQPDQRSAVLFLDLDRFKMVNDSFGHAVGDLLLIQASKRLRSCLRPTDTLARLGGDEFAVLLNGIRDASHAVRVAKRIQKELRSPFHLDGREVYSSTSIGIALSSDRSRQPEELLRDADTAMYRAKQRGRAGYAIFDAEMHEQVRLQLALETDFRRAVENAQLEVYYQPILRLEDHAVHGFEALLRWHHEERGLVTPNDFLPLAEETGLIHLLGRHALDVACRQAQRWNDASENEAPRFISVNLSPSQFAQHDLVRQVEVALEESGLDPSLLRLEIGERATMVHPESVLMTLQYLKELGVHLCLDNFGTGYSSLSVLHRFPFDSVKIDRWFVRQVNRDGQGADLVEGILGLCRWRKLETLAQGIETAVQREHLHRLGCRYGQGFLFTPAMAAQDIPTFLSQPISLEAGGSDR